MNKTKGLIFDSAIKIFSESGYRGATMDDIASNAGLVKGTLYYHFSSKEDIFNFIVKEGLTILQSQTIEVKKLNIDPIEKLTRICKIQLSFLYGHKDFFKVVMSQLWGNEERQLELRAGIRQYIDEIEINIKLAMLEGKIKEGDSALMAYEFFGMLCSATIYESINIRKINIEDMINSTIKFTLNGLGIESHN